MSRKVRNKAKTWLGANVESIVYSVFSIGNKVLYNSLGAWIMHGYIYKPDELACAHLILVIILITSEAPKADHYAGIMKA